MTISFGTDPELMVFDKSNQLVSAIPVVKSTKEKKLSLRNGHKLFYDNVLLEMNITPANSVDELVNCLHDALHQVSRTIYPYRMLPMSSCFYPQKECQHQDAMVFGCDPEYDAYTMSQVAAPICENTFRTAGGHIHLGTDTESYPLLAPIPLERVNGKRVENRLKRDWGRVWVVRMLDLFVGIPSLFLDPDNTSPARRKLYGRAGTHRPKEEYGVEYRTTGNFWLASPRITELVYKLCMFTVDFCAKELHRNFWKDENTCFGYDVDSLQRTINDSDKHSAEQLMETIVKKYLPDNLYIDIFKNHGGKPVNCLNFYQNWKL